MNVPHKWGIFAHPDIDRVCLSPSLDHRERLVGVRVRVMVRVMVRVRVRVRVRQRYQVALLSSPQRRYSEACWVLSPSCSVGQGGRFAKERRAAPPAARGGTGAAVRVGGRSAVVESRFYLATLRASPP